MRRSKCRETVVLSKTGEVLDAKTGRRHRCKLDAYDLPEYTRRAQLWTFRPPAANTS